MFAGARYERVTTRRFHHRTNLIVHPGWTHGNPINLFLRLVPGLSQTCHEHPPVFVATASEPHDLDSRRSFR